MATTRQAKAIKKIYKIMGLNLLFCLALSWNTKQAQQFIETYYALLLQNPDVAMKEEYHV